MTLLFAHSRPPVLLISGLAALTLGLPSSMDRVQAQSADVKLFPPPEVQVLLEHASTGASEALAASLGVTEIGGKSRIGAPGHAGSPRLRDVPVGVTSNDENEPTVVASPTDLKYLVAGSHSFPIGGRNRCAVYTSNDGGASWSTGAPMPQLTATSSCSDPVLAYAPDGSRVFYSYMDIKNVQAGGPPMFTITTDFDIVVSYSDDNGATWSSAVIALNGDPYMVTYSPCPSPPFPPGSFCGVLTEPGYAFDKNWIGTHPNSGDSNWVYVTATRFDTPGPSNIAFTQSSNSGLSYGPHQILDRDLRQRLARSSRDRIRPATRMAAWSLPGTIRAMMASGPGPSRFGRAIRALTGCRAPGVRASQRRRIRAKRRSGSDRTRSTNDGGERCFPISPSIQAARRTSCTPTTLWPMVLYGAGTERSSGDPDVLIESRGR